MSYTTNLRLFCARRWQEKERLSFRHGSVTPLAWEDWLRGQVACCITGHSSTHYKLLTRHNDPPLTCRQRPGLFHHNDISRASAVIRIMHQVPPCPHHFFPVQRMTRHRGYLDNHCFIPRFSGHNSLHSNPVCFKTATAKRFEYEQCLSSGRQS